MANKKSCFLQHSWPISSHSASINTALARAEQENWGGNDAEGRFNASPAEAGPRGALRQDRHFRRGGGGALPDGPRESRAQGERRGQAAFARSRLARHDRYTCWPPLMWISAPFT